MWECLGRNTSGLSLNSTKRKIHTKNWYSWAVKKRTPQRQYSGHNTPLGHHTDCGPMGLGKYNSLIINIVALILPPLCFLYYYYAYWVEVCYGTNMFCTSSACYVSVLISILRSCTCLVYSLQYPRDKLMNQAALDYSSSNLPMTQLCS